VPRRLRTDYPGAWHHVVNRGVARRTLFETKRDIRFFLSCLARQVRSGDLEVHAYAVLTTHFHLLVRSPRGALSRAMQRMLDAYARWFNRGRRRDGPLFRGRFTNRIVETESYWDNVVAYIDRNPVEAGLATRPEHYPHGSAYHYSRPKGPPWLRRDLVEGWRMGFVEGTAYDPERYAGSGETAPGQAWVVERRLERESARVEDPLDDLLGAAGHRVRDWMERKARLADGTSPGWILASPATVRHAVGGRRGTRPEWKVVLDSRNHAAWETMEAGFLRWFCGLRALEVARRIGVPRTTCQERVVRFRHAFQQSAEFRAEAADLLAEVLAADHGSGAFRKRLGFWRWQLAPDSEAGAGTVVRALPEGLDVSLAEGPRRIPR